MEAAAHAAPDGYTLLMAANSLATNNSLYPDLRFNGLRDFAPVAQIGYAPLMIVVPADSPIHSLRELLETARKSPGKLSYASAGPGSTNHLSAVLFEKMAGVEMLHVPYKGGAPAVVDTVAGQTQLLFSAGTQTLPHVKANKLRLLAVTEPKRSWPRNVRRRRQR